MKTKMTLTLLAALGALALTVNAQDAGGPPREGGPRGPGMGGHRPPPPIEAVLDANHDGVIDADEIANASTALKTLDKNGDGKLTREELRPPRPEGRPEGQGGPDQDGPPQGPPPGN